MDPTSSTVTHIGDAPRPLAPRAVSPPTVGPADFRIDGWLVQPSLNRFTRDAVVVRVRPQLMDLLVCLARHAGAVLGRDQLVADVWEGRWVADSAVSRCIAELRAVLADSAQQPRIIETISKRGYRLIAPVEPASPSQAPDADEAPPAEFAAATRQNPRSVRAWLANIVRRCIATTDDRT